ncbi:MAG TPA: nuclease A inhibitor family protein [Phormidium sp.]
MNQPTTSADIVNQLKLASDGLQCMSESDYPFEVFQWEGQEPVTAQTVIQQTGHTPNTQVEVVQLDEFFRNATQEQDWHNDEEKEVVKRYQSLVETLKQSLSDIQVYRLGTVEIDVYIVGKTPSGNLAGLSTKVVET